jgi:deoxyribodipyrimidine photo-lyase
VPRHLWHYRAAPLSFQPRPFFILRHPAFCFTVFMSISLPTPTIQTPHVLCWLRRDLRLQDHAALHHALQSGLPVACVFVFDSTILDSLPADDVRVAFILDSLQSLQEQLRQHGSELITVHGDPVQQIPLLANHLNAQTVYANEDYEPAALTRDHAVSQSLAAQGRVLKLFKDQVIFARDEILTQQKQPYTVFTPYKRNWLARIQPSDIQAYDCSQGQWAPLPAQALPCLKELGFHEEARTKLLSPAGWQGAQTLLQQFEPRIHAYHERRDFPAKRGVSYLAPHLRFGTLSIRQAVALAWPSDSEGAATWLSELIWREFYQQFLWHHPETAQESFKPAYKNLPFPNRDDWFQAWKDGQTGYPIVDAAMRQLNQSGYMHNRLRMISASFLVKDLLIDWRWGEQYFAQKLLDYDMASNVGGWQWAASTGCDAQPYFRIFNPITQSRKFDPEGQFIRRYVPELASLDKQAIHAPWQAKQLPLAFRLGQHYPAPIVDHDTQRHLALALFKQAGEQEAAD